MLAAVTPYSMQGPYEYNGLYALARACLAGCCMAGWLLAATRGPRPPLLLAPLQLVPAGWASRTLHAPMATVKQSIAVTSQRRCLIVYCL